MYAIITKSTDMRYPNHKIEFTSSISRVRKALNTDEKYTYNNPEEQKNWHIDIVSVYEMPYGWRRPTASFIAKEVSRMRGSIYSPNANGVMYQCIVRDGTRVNEI